MSKEVPEAGNKTREIQLLEEIAKWTRLQGKQQTKNIVKSLLSDEKKRLIYHLSDGRSSPEIAKIVKVDPSTVRDDWKSWAAEGIVELCLEYKRRYRRVFLLEELGLEVPEVKVDQENPTEEIGGGEK